MGRRGGARDAADPSAGAADDATRALLQARLRLVFTVLAGVALFYALSHTATILITEPGAAPPLPVRVVTWLIGVGNALLVVRLRRGRRSLAELHGLDVAATAVTCWLIAGLLTLLPSSGKRTLAVAVAALVPAGLVGTRLRVADVGDSAATGDWLMHGWIVFRNLA